MLQDLRLDTAPAELAVSLEEAKAHLRVLNNSQDGPIGDALAAAIGLLDGYSGILGRCLVEQSWLLSFECWPGRTIKLPLPPLISVEEIAYVDQADADQVVSPALYHVLEGPLATIRLKPTAVWPTLGRNPRAVTISFTAGYGAAADVPGALKAAIKLILGELFENREAEILTVAAFQKNPAVQRLLRPFTIPRV